MSFAPATLTNFKSYEFDISPGVRTTSNFAPSSYAKISPRKLSPLAVVPFVTVAPCAYEVDMIAMYSQRSRVAGLDDDDDDDDALCGRTRGTGPSRPHPSHLVRQCATRDDVERRIASRDALPRATTERAPGARGAVDIGDRRVRVRLVRE